MDRLACVELIERVLDELNEIMNYFIAALDIEIFLQQNFYYQKKCVVQMIFAFSLLKRTTNIAN